MHRLRPLRLGLPVMARARWILAAGVMKKCTLCIDRIYNETIPRDRPRAISAVRTCPTNARHYGDLADPGSDVSKMVAARAVLT